MTTFLMLGGPAHGLKLTIKAGTYTKYLDEDGKYWEYQHTWALEAGKKYPVALTQSVSDKYPHQDYDLGALINSSGLEPFGSDDRIPLLTTG